MTFDSAGNATYTPITDSLGTPSYTPSVASIDISTSGVVTIPGSGTSFYGVLNQGRDMFCRNSHYGSWKYWWY